jgi:hypothetical protein
MDLSKWSTQTSTGNYWKALRTRNTGHHRAASEKEKKYIQHSSLKPYLLLLQPPSVAPTLANEIRNFKLLSVHYVHRLIGIIH